MGATLLADQSVAGDGVASGFRVAPMERSYRNAAAGHSADPPFAGAAQAATATQLRPAAAFRTQPARCRLPGS